MTLLSPSRSLMLVIDIQERLAAVVSDAEQIVARTSLLLQAAALLHVPVLASEQYPQGLGATLPELARLIPSGGVMEKLAFSVTAEPAVLRRLAATGRNQLVLAGMEAHICVLQSAIGLKQAGYEVHVVADAVGSRRPEDARRAFGRLHLAGIEVTTSEMVAYEWARRAGTSQFKAMSRLLRA